MNTNPTSASKPTLTPGTAVMVLAFVGILVVLTSFVLVLRDHVQRGKAWRNDVRVSGVHAPEAAVAGAALVLKPRAVHLAEASGASER